MTPARAPWRLFIAAYPPPETTAAYLAALDHLDLAPHRATPADQIHLTLHFVGPVPEPEVERVLASIGRACSGIDAFALHPVRLTTLPDRGAPRLVALEMAPSPPASELHARLVHRLARGRAPARTYLPHLTLCRFAPGAAPDPLSRGVDLPAFTVDRIRLVRSLLRPSGAVHAEVASWLLGGAAGGPVAD